jgi:octaprenyl-diphosphate synthase
MQHILNLVKEDFDAVNSLIIKQLSSDVGLVESIGHHLIDAGGKRLRPLLVLLSARALQAKPQAEQTEDASPLSEHHTQFAAVIEFIHSATLLHDDVVDMSNLRRGLPTANAKWGNAPSVLVGDFIYSRAFQLLVEIGLLDIMRLMANTTNEIAEGEVLQLTKAGDPSTTEAQYMDVIARKTAILFAAATKGAAELSLASQNQIDALATYGHNLGIAFQLMDDVLDYEGDPEKMGKNVGDDLSEGKPTLPLIYTIKNGSEAEAALIEHAIREKTAANLDQIAQIIKNNGALEYTKAMASQLADDAIKQLEQLNDSPYKEALIDIAHLSAQRDN